MESLELKSSSERIGQLYPILVDCHGKIIDGQHRYSVDKGWKTMRLNHIRTEKDRLIARIISNIVRRSVSQREKTELLAELGEIYLNEGVEPGRIAYKIAEETGMSYTWVMKYLPDKFKDSAQSERANSATRRVAKQHEEPKEEEEVTEPPKEKILTIQKYANTSFVNVLLERPFYTQLEKTAEKLQTTPDVIISNILLKGLKELEERLERRKKEQR